MSSDSRATVVQIRNKIPHPNADSLSITYVFGDGGEGGGYPVVIKTSDYQIGDLALYVPIDLICPQIPEFAFLGPREKDRRIRAKRLRGVFSMGLIVPCDSYEGADMTDSLGFVKWEPPPQHSGGIGRAGGKYLPGDTEIGISSKLCPIYTDIENVRRWSKTLTEGEEVVMTEKIHGANARFVFANDRLYVGSRTRFIKPDSVGLWPGIARACNLAQILANCPGIAIYGEAYGQVQDLKYGRSDASLAIFDAMEVATGRYLDWPEIEALVDRLNDLGHGTLTIVPVLYRGPWLGYAAHKALAEGPSVLGGGSCIREGVVIRPVAERSSPGLGRTILKMVGEGYLTR